MKTNLSPKNKIILSSATVSIILIIVGILFNDSGILGNMVIISVFISVAPLLIYRYSMFMRIRAIESQFPNFVRDIADSKRSGMSFREAVKISTKSNYGKLSPEIAKMSNRMSWGTPFVRALEIFGDEMKDSKIIHEALNIMKESFASGGKVADTLESVASDMIMIKEAEAERTSLVREQVMIMYGIFFMFLAVSVIIIFVLIPMMKNPIGVTGGAGGIPGMTGAGGMAFSNPCEAMKGISFPCSLFNGVCLVMGVGSGTACYYTSLFFTVVVLQGIFMGLIAGQLGENSVTAGTKHSMIMTMAAISVFMFIAKAGLFPK